MTDAAPTCARCHSPAEPDDLRCPICSHASPLDARRDTEATTVEILRCSGCGAAVSYSVAAGAPECAFCGSVTHIEVPEDPLEQTELTLPFTVDRAGAETAYTSWLAGLGWFRPSDLVSASSLESIRPLWWVGWVFDAEALVSWTADSDAGARRADWAPHAGQTEFAFDTIVVSASRGLTYDETTHLTPSYNLETAQEEAGETRHGAIVEQFDVQRSSARQRVAAAIEKLAAHRLQSGPIPGRRFRNLHIAVLLRRLVTRRFAFPSWVLAYRYRGRLYRTVLSGQDEGCIRGTAPYSVVKIVLAIGGAVLALALLLATLA